MPENKNLLSKPWSKKHKVVTGRTSFSLSNSFAQPLSMAELIQFSHDRGDLDIIEQYYNHGLSYTPNGGSLDLREEIAALYGPAITAEHIVVFPGAQIALQTVANALLDADSHSIVFSPSYQSLQATPLHVGSAITTIELKAESGWQIDPEEVATAIRPNTKYIVLNEPNNPTGTLMAKEVQGALVALADAHGIHILSDEVYRLLEHEDGDRLPAMADLYGKGISVVTLSKPWGGCGIAIGWVALQDRQLRDRIIDCQYFGCACPSRASEIQGIMTLRASDTILKRNRAIIRNNFRLLCNFMEKYRDYFTWVKPRAGAIAYIKFTGPFSSEELGEQLAAQGISIKPSYVFSGFEKEDSGYFRVGYGEEIMPQALAALADYVEEQKVHWDC